METPKHTPGPWEVSPKDRMRVNVKTGSLLHPYEPRIATEEDIEENGDDCHDDYNICQCDDEWFMRPPKECEANARLIAAAPKLLEECELFLDIARSMPQPKLIGWDWKRITERLQNLIAEAKGEQP